MAPYRSARLVAPLGFPPRPSSPPLQPVAVESGAVGGGDTGGAGAQCPTVIGGAGGTRAGGASTGVTGVGSAGGTGAGGASARGAGGTGAAGAGCSGASGARGAGTGGAGGNGAAGAVGTGATSARGVGARGAGGIGAAGAGGNGATGARGAGDGGAGGTGAAGVGGTGATGCGGAGARGAGGPGARGYGTVGIVRPFSYPQPQSSLPPPDSALRQFLSLMSSTCLTWPFLCPLPDQSQPQLLTGSPLPAPSPYAVQTGSLAECCEPESRPASHVHTVSRARRPRPPPLPGTHTMALRPSSVPQNDAMPSPPTSSLIDVLDLESDLAQAASPTVTHFLATLVTDPSFESATANALVTELVDFAATCCLDYFTSLITESESDCPPSAGGELAPCSDVLEDRQFELECLAAVLPHLASMLLCPEGDANAQDIPTPCSYAEAITGAYSSQWQIAMDAEMASWKSTGTYVDEVPHPGANIVDGMWIFRVKRPSGSPPAFKAHYVARGFSQRQGVDFFHTFYPTTKMTALRVLLHVAAQRDYKLHSFEFSTAFLQGSLHEEIWLRRPPGFTGSFPEGTQWSRRRPVYGLRLAPSKWHNTLRTTLAALRFTPSTADLSLSAHRPFFAADLHPCVC
ncbi:unnamed protein product [Closterium sp. Naga37s-1]|nr:unnamed protein product [Closterium sp. Naga37s-1]